MFLLFLLIAIVSCILSFLSFHTRLNPISIYFIIWVFCLLLIELKVIEFNTLSEQTWILINAYSLVYTLSFLMGSSLVSKKVSQSVYSSNGNALFLKQFDEAALKKYLNRTIFFCTAISWLSIIPSVVKLVGSYGLNLVANSNQIYEDSISNLAGSNAGGLSLENFVFVAIVFAGVYVRKFGMSFSVSMALMTAMLGQLTSGSRGGLFVQVALLVGPWILIPKGKTKGKDQSNIGVRVAVVLALAFLLIITYLRKSSLIDLPYATPNLKKLGGFSSLVYNISFYFTSPIATLNEFLKSPVHTYWGASTFRPFYLLLNSLGVTTYNVDFYNIFLFYSPLPANVVSYIGELILDFGTFGGGVATFIFGAIFGVSYRKSRSNYSSLTWLVVMDICFALMVLSFFAWFLRPAYLWFSLIVGVFISALAGVLIKHKKIW